VQIFGQSIEELGGLQVISQIIAVGEQALFDAANLCLNFGQS